MNRLSRLGVAAAVGTVLMLALPLAAQAKTWTVYQGLPTTVQQQKTFLGGHDVDAIDFFPHRLTIHVGDKVTFDQTAFHQLDLPPRHGKQLTLLVATGTVGHVVGKDGSPFWYSDQPLPNFGFNPKLITGNPKVDYSPTKRPAKHGRHVKYDGSKRVLTPIPFNAGPKPITIKFTRAGTYRYYCDLHPGEMGVVRVLPKRKSISRKAYGRSLKRQIARDRKVAKHIYKHHPLPADTVSVGYAGKHHVEVFRYLPQTLHTKVGVPVTFEISPRSVESHTATTAGPHDPETEPDTTIGQIAASFFAPLFDPRGVYPSTKPGDPSTVSLTSFGEGFWNSGVLDNQKATPEAFAPTSRQVTFTQAGTYDFYCMVHPQMHGKVVVSN